MKSNKKKKKSKWNLWLGIGAVALLALVAWFSLGGSGGPSLPDGLRLVATMSPSYFSNDPKAQAAYQVAKEIPEILAQLPCFCGCMSQFGHENNLFCFRDEHGSGCAICEDIALDARDMHKKGFSIDRIKEAIRSRYGRSGQ